MVGLVKSNSFVGVPGAGIGKDDLIAWIQAAENFNRVDRALAQLDRCAHRFVAAGNKFKHSNGVIFLAERGPADKNNVVETLELDRSIDTQIGTGAFRQFFIERD